MKKHSFWRISWSRLLLWSHVIGVIGFYLTLWQRTRPAKTDQIQKLLPRTTTRPQGQPLVSVIVPARNEEVNIWRCVNSLLNQDYDNFEVIVVDDGSTDGTGRILDEMASTHPHGDRLYVLRLRDALPEGWAGKPHTIHKGTQEAHGEWLLFTDADTWHAPEALRSTLAQAIAEQADLFSIGSRQELPTFWEKTLMPIAFMGVSMLYPPKLVNDPTSAVAVANGQYILLRRAVYDALGGYARPELRGTLLDDRDLARLVKSQGYRLRFVDGGDLLFVHMYRNFSEIWSGWRKNAYLGNRGGLAFFLLQLIGLPMISLIPFLLPLLPLFTRRLHAQAIGRSEAGIATALELTPLLAYRTWLNQQFHLPWYYAWLHPLAASIFEGILAQSCWRIITGAGVDWRGRQYHNGHKGESALADVARKS